MLSYFKKKDRKALEIQHPCKKLQRKFRFKRIYKLKLFKHNMQLLGHVRQKNVVDCMAIH